MKIILRIAKLSVEITEDGVQVPARVQKLAAMWANGASCAEIGAEVNQEGTTCVSNLRKAYPDLFPYRNPKSRRNGMSTHR